MKIKPSEYSNILNKYNSEKVEGNKNINNEANKLEEKNIEGKNYFEDKIDISENYKMHNEALEQLKEMDAKERREKVESLKKQINEGKYEVDLEEISKKITDKLL
ncbi:MAG: flagellar biosynthesis anti-sigma factor FlgM [Bacillota bacterium]|nr:flagellar biosynthesis anti-sigma factor FlgM [Bacillota bacterium]